MKNSNLALIGLYFIAAATIMIAPSCSKKDEVTPVATVAGVSFVTSLSGSGVLIYSNRTTNPAVTGSFFSYVSGVVGGSALANSNFRIVDKGTNTAPSLFLANTSTDGKGVADATSFAASSLSYTSATAQNIKDAGSPTASEIAVAANSVYLFQSASGWRGILNVDKVETDTNASVGGGSGTVTTQKVTFSYKIISK
ncbi:MAG: hypothetical protein ACKVOU_05010 [Cytophagales bacterium]